VTWSRTREELVMETKKDRDTWYQDVPRSARVPTVLGLAAVGATVFGFGVWANAAPIAGAVVATGVFVATNENKVVQHLEGGVIREILVREGDVVEAGETLILLDETAARAELRRLELREARLNAVAARLRAEVEGADTITFAPELLARSDDPDVAAAIEAQRLTFGARKRSLDSEIATLEASIAALEERRAGTERQRESVERQLLLIDEELEGKLALLDRGIMRRPEVLAVQRASAHLQGEAGRLMGELGNIREQSARAREQIASLRNSRVEESVELLEDNQGELKDIWERMTAARDVLLRVRITAPVRGIVVKMRYHTPGGVVESGRSVMEIVPLDEGLVIEARVRPQDIDVISVGQSASVRLTALNARLTPMIGGEVVYVSADVLPNESESTGDVYEARIELDAEEAAEIEGFVPTAGMPVEVYIKTTERTFLQYLLEPLRDSMSRAFRET
jgi:HlyD family type I secretion membrane fusion protein